MYSQKINIKYQINQDSQIKLQEIIFNPPCYANLTTFHSNPERVIFVYNPLMHGMN